MAGSYHKPAVSAKGFLPSEQSPLKNTRTRGAEPGKIEQNCRQTESVIGHVIKSRECAKCKATSRLARL